MRFLSLILLSLTLACAEPPPKPLPADAQAAIDKADKSAAAVQQKADAEIVKIRQAMIAALTKAQETATKKGDLDTALAIKAKVDAASKAMGDLLPTPSDPVKDTEPLIVGKWKASHGYLWDIQANGVCVMTKGNGTWSGTWKIDGPSVAVSWSTGYNETIKIPKAGASETTGIGGTGANLTFKKE